MFFPSPQLRSLLSICYTIVFIPSTLLFLLAIYFVLYQKSLASKYYKKVIVFQLVSAFIGDIMISLIRPIFLMQIRIVIFQMSWDLPFVGIMIALVSLRSNKLYQGFEGGYGIAIFLSYGCFMNGSLYKIITLYSLPSYVAWLLNVYFLGGYGAVFVLGATFMLNILRTGGLSDDRKVICSVFINSSCDKFDLHNAYHFAQLDSYQAILRAMAVISLLLFLGAIGIAIYSLYQTFFKPSKKTMSQRTKKIQHYLTRMTILQGTVIIACLTFPYGCVVLSMVDIFENDLIVGFIDIVSGMATFLTSFHASFASLITIFVSKTYRQVIVEWIRRIIFISRMNVFKNRHTIMQVSANTSTVK